MLILSGLPEEAVDERAGNFDNFDRLSIAKELTPLDSRNGNRQITGKRKAEKWKIPIGKDASSGARRSIRHWRIKGDMVELAKIELAIS